MKGGDGKRKEYKHSTTHIHTVREIEEWRDEEARECESYSLSLFELKIFLGATEIAGEGESRTVERRQEESRFVFIFPDFYSLNCLSTLTLLSVKSDPRLLLLFHVYEEVKYKTSNSTKV